MAFIAPERGKQALQDYLGRDEQIKTWAYGRQQSTLLMVVCVLATECAAMLLTAWAWAGSSDLLLCTLVFWAAWLSLLAGCERLIRKDYLVALTTERLLIVRLRTPLLLSPDPFDQIAHRDYPLAGMPPMEFKQGRTSSKLQIFDSTRPPFMARFGIKAGRKDNGPAILEIVRAIESSRGPAKLTASAT